MAERDREPVRAARRRAFRLGLKAEARAAWRLRLAGFRIVATRYKTRAGEVDLIARRGDLVLMVEVKARANLEAAVQAVTTTAWRRIEAAGDHWLARQPDHARLSIRYDLIAVVKGRLVPYWITAAHQPC